MPVLGQGLIPSGAIANDLTAITRRAYIPTLITQLYTATPTMAALFSQAEAATGGISSMTQPTQMNALTTPSWSDFGMSFAAPQVQTGILNAEMNLSVLMIPIPVYGAEALVQMDHAVIRRMDAVFNDAAMGTAQTINTALFNNTSNTQQIIGLPGAIDDGTNLVTYANISRTTYPAWKSKVYTVTGNPTRADVLTRIKGTEKAGGGETPTFGVMGVATWVQLATDFMGLERYNITPYQAFDSIETPPRSAYTAIMVGNVPIFGDPSMPEGVLYLINTNYLKFYVHKDATFVFSGFYSLVPNNQLAYQGVLVLVLGLLNTKPSTCSRTSGYTYPTI